MSEDSLKQVAAVIAAKRTSLTPEEAKELAIRAVKFKKERGRLPSISSTAVSYTHLRAHETVLDLVCRLLLEKQKA